jgi:hypothetical protein
MIGDARAFAPLMETLQNGHFMEEPYPITYPKKDQYDIREYCALALGYLGDTRAVMPLISHLKATQSRWAIHALARLGDMRAVRPMIEVASGYKQFSYPLHHSIEYLTGASFELHYSKENRNFQVVELPELGALEHAGLYHTLWRYWLDHGSNYARNRFEKYYPQWRQVLLESPQDISRQDYHMRKMLRAGIVTLPYVIAEIEKGDAKLVPAVHQLTKGKALKKDATQSEVLEWWKKDKEKWLISDPNQSNPGDR